MVIDEIKKIETLKAMEKFVITALEQNASDKNKGRELWMLLPPEWKRGVVASVAWTNSFIEKNEVLGKMDHSYYIDKAAKDAESCLDLPRRILKDFRVFQKIAHLLLHHDYVKFCDIYNAFPEHQRYDREIWMNIAVLDDNFEFFAQESLEHPEQLQIWSDRDVMWKAVNNRPRNAEFVLGPLRRDQSFWESLLDESPSMLFFLPSEVVIWFRDLVISSLNKPSIVHSCHNISPFEGLALRLSHGGLPDDFYCFWLEAGLPLLNNNWDQPQLQQLERRNRKADIYLLVAKHCKTVVWREQSFEELPGKLRSDKEFFMRVVAYSPDLFHAASIELQLDTELAALACSKSADALNHDLAIMIEMKEKFKKLLLLYKAFGIFQNFLLHSSNECIDICPMALLPKDESFVQRLDNDIASFAGLPNLMNMKTKMQVLLSAIQNIDSIGPVFSEENSRSDSS